MDEREREGGGGKGKRALRSCCGERESTEPVLRKGDPYLLLRPVDEFFIYFFCLL